MESHGKIESHLGVLIERAEVWAWRMMIKLGFQLAYTRVVLSLKSCQLPDAYEWSGMCVFWCGEERSRSASLLSHRGKVCPLTSFLAVGHIFMRTQERKGAAGEGK